MYSLIVEITMNASTEEEVPTIAYTLVHTPLPTCFGSAPAQQNIFVRFRPTISNLLTLSPLAHHRPATQTKLSARIRGFRNEIENANSRVLVQGNSMHRPMKSSDTVCPVQCSNR